VGTQTELGASLEKKRIGRESWGKQKGRMRVGYKG
jgi:hypothetical protein